MRGIIKIFEKENRILARDFCKTFNTTAVTTRKELDLLESEGVLKRTHGEVILYKPLFHGLALSEKGKFNAIEKEYSTSEAIKMIFEGNVVLVDSCPTNRF